MSALGGQISLCNAGLWFLDDRHMVLAVHPHRRLQHPHVLPYFPAPAIARCPLWDGCVCLRERGNGCKDFSGAFHDAQ